MNDFVSDQCRVPAEDGPKQTNKRPSVLTRVKEHLHHLSVTPRGRSHERRDAVAAAVVRRRLALEQLREDVYSALPGG